jgi:hypothetical protein
MRLRWTETAGGGGMHSMPDGEGVDRKHLGAKIVSFIIILGAVGSLQGVPRVHNIVGALQHVGAGGWGVGLGLAAFVGTTVAYFKTEPTAMGSPRKKWHYLWGWLAGLSLLVVAGQTKFFVGLFDFAGTFLAIVGNMLVGVLRFFGSGNV